ncbi:MAG: hypothetical protein L6R28_18420 [Planctomycetes bacterium]|nr:hypothetical protein [Planctomycetota bacterium]
MRASEAAPTPTLPKPALSASTEEDAEDLRLLKAIAERRDRAAFRRFYERYERTAYNLAYHLTSDQDRAAEAVQSGMVCVWTSAASIPPGSNARAWLLRIVARESLRVVEA